VVGVGTFLKGEREEGSGKLVSGLKGVILAAVGIRFDMPQGARADGGGKRKGYTEVVKFQGEKKRGEGECSGTGRKRNCELPNFCSDDLEGSREIRIRGKGEKAARERK